MYLDKNNYRNYLSNEYDFQLYVYYILKSKGYKLYIDRNIKKLLKNEYAKKLSSKIVFFDKYTIEQISGKFVGGKPDFFLNISDFYSLEEKRNKNFSPFIAIECKYPKDGEMSPIYKIREQVESFKNIQYYCDGVAIKNPSIYLLTPLMFFDSLKNITDWVGISHNLLNTDLEISKIVHSKINETLIQSLYGFLDVGLFGKVSMTEDIFGINDFSRRIRTAEIHRFR